ncbi:hypothetical protein B9Z19DRAFT_1192256 [Tuber borchii]|uniref:Uncharacterized protein n=1 Tax=Tuber borchii TaxID=42251 RepID=A0A2T6ZWP6_TUBBO|nr:hypothetical protein B9Z19DRAFT_1192256 [Tuber borchii]
MDDSIINSPFPHHSEPPFVSPFITPRTHSRLRNPTTLTTTRANRTPTRATRSQRNTATTTDSITTGNRTISTPLPAKTNTRLSTLSQPAQATSSPHYAQETISSAAKRRFREEEEEGMGGGIHERIAVLEAEIRMLREQRGWIVGMIEEQKKKGGRIPGGGENDKGRDSGDGDGEGVTVVGYGNDDEDGDGIVREKGNGNGVKG